MNSLVIGLNSQLSYYFPSDYEVVSSRNLDFQSFVDKTYDRAFICFAEQRTFLRDADYQMFHDVNVDYTKKVIEFFGDKCNSIVVYGTSELWNNYKGAIDTSLKFNYIETPYIRSKEAMCHMVDELRQHTKAKIIVVHPYNFNSPYRKDGFLFSKIFRSILNKEKVEIGDVNIFRDLIHPRYVVQKSIEAQHDIVVGSGKLTFVKGFIQNLYEYNGLNYDSFVTENLGIYQAERKVNYSRLREYDNLLIDTLDDFTIHNKASQ